MPRHGLLQALAINDVLQTWSWSISFPRIPGVSDTRSLAAKCISSEVPQVSVEPVAWEAQGGVKLMFRGKKTWSNSWTATFVESRDGATREAFIQWTNLMHNPLTGLGAYKTQYAVPADLTQYDDAGLPARVFKLVNAWPSEVGQASLDQSSGIVQYTIQFAFDYVEEDSK